MPTFATIMLSPTFGYTSLPSLSEKPVQLDPNRLLLVENLVQHFGNLYLYVSAHTCIHLSFSSLPSCHLLSDDKCSITVNLYMIPLLYQESFMPPLPSSTHFEQRECSIVVYIAVHFYNSKDIHSTLCLISVFWFVLYFVLYISVNKMWPYIVYSPQYRHLAILPIY